LPLHNGVEQDIIGVTKEENAKQPHHKGLMLAYLMENEMPFVHHAKKQ
jgi:hypothetical protein